MNILYVYQCSMYFELASVTKIIDLLFFQKENTWRHWSKVGLLLQELHRSKVQVI